MEAAGNSPITVSTGCLWVLRSLSPSPSPSPPLMKDLILIVVVMKWPCGLPCWLLETSAPGPCELGGPGNE